MSIETYIIEFSKYVIAIIMALYALESILVFVRRNEEKRKGLYIRQNILMFLFHFSCFMVICFETGKISFLIFYAFQQIILYAAIMLYKAVYPSMNRFLINNMCMLLSISFVILTRLDYSKAIKQFAIASGSIAISMVIPFVVNKFKFLKNLKWIYAAIGIGLLGIMMILGQTTYGSKISYSIAGISFQPAEFVKILFVFFVASSLYKAESLLEILSSTFFAAIHVLIQVVNKDLGSALILFIVYICMLYIATQNVLYLILGLGAGAGASVIAYQMFSHVQNRVAAFLDPFANIDSTGYQITQSLFAISSGGWFGLGLYKGAPESIPFVDVDFIFSALTEEFGILFGISLVIICLSIFAMIMLIAMKTRDKFSQLLAIGFGITYIFQVFLTIGGGTKFIPLTGVTLPLVSYGGTSVLCTVIMFAAAGGVSITYADEENDEYYDEYYDDEYYESDENGYYEDEYYEDEYYEDEYYEEYEEEYYEDEVISPKTKRIARDDKQKRSKVSKKKIETEYKKTSKGKKEKDKKEKDNKEKDRKEKTSKENHQKEKRKPAEHYQEERIRSGRVKAEQVSDEKYKKTTTVESRERDRKLPVDGYEEDDMTFLHGFTEPIDIKTVRELCEEDSDDFSVEPDDYVGEILYSEEEYEKDLRRRTSEE